MTDSSAVRGAGVAPVTAFGVALPDLSALGGAVLWTGAVALGELGTIDRAVAFAPLVLVPLALGLVARPPFAGTGGLTYRAATLLQPLAAVALLGSLLAPRGIVAAVLAVPWVVVCGLLGFTALARVRERGISPLAETAVDAGLAYVSVGAVALVLSHLGVTVWFEPVIVLLTAVHFHYAGFVLPVTTGLAGRCGTVAESRIYCVLTALVLVGPAVIALGISFSPLVEVLAVGGFTLAVAALGVYVVVRVVPQRPPLQGLLVGASALALPVSMAFALGYGLTAYGGQELFPVGLSIGTMVAWHGTVNAFGFGLLAVVGWRVTPPPMRSARSL